MGRLDGERATLCSDGGDGSRHPAAKDINAMRTAQ